MIIGVSAESVLSNPVMVEQALPAGAFAYIILNSAVFMLKLYI